MPYLFRKDNVLASKSRHNHHSLANLSGASVQLSSVFLKTFYLASVLVKMHNLLEAYSKCIILRCIVHIGLRFVKMCNSGYNTQNDYVCP